MADRACATMTIGGTLPSVLLDDLYDAITMDGAYLDWDYTRFDAATYTGGEPLSLVGQELAGGRFTQIEDFCLRHGLAFRRWSGSCPGVFDAEEVVAPGDGTTTSYSATDNGIIVADLATLRELGSMAAIEAYFADAARPVGPLVLSGEASVIEIAAQGRGQNMPSQAA